jgi:hypothetical protein
MKMFIALMLLSTVAFAGPNRILPVTKESEQVKKDKMAQEKLKMLDKNKKAEDCDDKAKKPVEIKPESISLGGGTAGCTLDEAH